MRHLLSLSIILTIIIIISFYDIIADFIRFTGYIAVVTLAMVALITIIFGAATAVERWRKMRTEREASRYEARRRKYEIIKDGFGMVHLLNLETDIIENLSAFPGTHHNGRWEDPHPAAAAAWFALVGRVRSESPVGLLPAGQQVVSEPQMDLLTVMTQPTQSYAIIAGQQVGKTFQARRIANHWIQNGLKPLVVGPKWDRGEWEGCTLFGGEYNFERVIQGMRIIKKLAEDRHADNRRAHKEHPVQPVFFDDWTAIRAKLPEEAEAFILDATTLYASVNIILYFILHLDTANAWGVGKIGAALKNNFIKLLIEPGYDEGGLIDRRRNSGFILMPGQTMKDKRPVRLFGGTGQEVVLPDLVIQPTDEERRVLEALRQAQDATANSSVSRKEISEAVWGSGKFGKFYNEKIDRILAKYGLELSKSSS